MARFMLEIDTSNDAFEPDTVRVSELGRILHTLAALIVNVTERDEGGVKDANGNTVGTWWFEE